MADAPRAHVTVPVGHVLERLPGWVTLVRAANPGVMTLEGTNTWILRPEQGPAFVVDPGPADEAHLEAVAGHGPFARILLTHRHPDHAGGLAAFRKIVGDVPVSAAPGPVPAGAGPAVAPVGAAPGAAGRGRDAGTVDFDPLADGAVLRTGPLRCTVLLTPGHTADSACFLADNGTDPVLLTGDTVLGRGTTVVAWPDGNLGDYLDSLDRLAGFDGVPVLPGHGPALADAGAAARFYLDHRRARLDQVRAAVAAGARTPEDVTAAVYADVDPALLPYAQWTVRAQLAYLTSRGQP